MASPAAGRPGRRDDLRSRDASATPFAAIKPEEPLDLSPLRRARLVNRGRNRAPPCPEPSEALLRRTALSMALWGTATFLMLGVFAVVAAGGDLAALPPGLWMSILATVAIYAATLLIVGYLLFGAVARRVAADRA
ncbi:hypothetical protein [Mangrovicoccus ximenensis]|uniref:hypothetical protein n=1 Tax=Mangrovicoccus ximenensis TaxID=1911570 RepID=UPI000D3D50F9|nr:hypothetical protein [Mangrovicoccus ximenensis]